MKVVLLLCLVLVSASARIIHSTSRVFHLEKRLSRSDGLFDVAPFEFCLVLFLMIDWEIQARRDCGARQFSGNHRWTLTLNCKYRKGKVFWDWRNWLMILRFRSPLITKRILRYSFSITFTTTLLKVTMTILNTSLSLFPLTNFNMSAGLLRGVRQHTSLGGFDRKENLSQNSMERWRWSRRNNSTPWFN